MDSLTALLHEEATLSMPPYELWLQGPENIAGWMLGQGNGCRGLAARAGRGQRLTGVRPVPPRASPGRGYEPWSLTVLETADGQVTGINSFLDTDRLFPLFGLPPRIEDASTNVSSATSDA